MLYRWVVPLGTAATNPPWPDRDSERGTYNQEPAEVTLTLNVDSDEPVLVLVLVVPLRKAAPRSTPPSPPARPAIDTTLEVLPDNVVPFRRAVGA